MGLHVNGYTYLRDAQGELCTVPENTVSVQLTGGVFNLDSCLAAAAVNNPSTSGKLSAIFGGSTVAEDSSLVKVKYPIAVQLKHSSCLKTLIQIPPSRVMTVTI